MELGRDTNSLCPPWNMTTFSAADHLPEVDNISSVVSANMYQICAVGEVNLPCRDYEMEYLIY